MVAAAGDTEEFQVQLEAKQRELAPWQDKKAKVRRQCVHASEEGARWVHVLTERLHRTLPRPG